MKKFAIGILIILFLTFFEDFPQSMIVNTTIFNETRVSMSKQENYTKPFLPVLGFSDYNMIKMGNDYLKNILTTTIL